MSNFYGTRIEIWAVFGQVGNTGKKLGPIMSNSFFMFSWANEFNFFFKYRSVRTRELHKKKVKEKT